MHIMGGARASFWLLLSLLLSVSAHGADEAKLLFSGTGKTAVGFLPDGRLVAHSSNSVGLYDLSKGIAPATEWNAPVEERIIDGALAPEGRTLALVFAVGKDRSRIQFHETATGKALKPEIPSADVSAISFSPDGKLLAGIHSETGNVRVWNSATGALHASMDLPSQIQAGWLGVVFSPDGRFLAARNSFGYTFWEIATKEIATPGGMRDIMIGMSPDWKHAIGFLHAPDRQGPPEPVVLDFTQPKKPIAVSTPELKGFEWMNFSADSQLWAVLQKDKSVRLWDAAKRGFLKPSLPNLGAAIDMQFSPDKRFLVTYSRDFQRRQRAAEVRIWDVAAGAALCPPQPVNGYFMECHFDPAGNYLALTFAAGEESFIWKLPPAK